MHTPKDPKPNKFAVRSVPPMVEFEDGKPMLAYTFSTLLDDDPDGLQQVLRFADRVLDYDPPEVTLEILTPLENILDLTIEGCVLWSAPKDGMDHVSDEHKDEIESLKNTLQTMIDRINRIQYHNHNPDS